MRVLGWRVTSATGDRLNSDGAGYSDSGPGAQVVRETLWHRRALNKRRIALALVLSPVRHREIGRGNHLVGFRNSRTRASISKLKRSSAVGPSPAEGVPTL